MSAEIVLGSMEIGVLASSIIYGVTCIQCYLYFVEHSENDPNFLKSLVVTMMALETFDVALLSHALYTHTVKDFGELSKPIQMTWSFLLRVSVSAALSTLAQSFFALRIYYLNGRRLYLPIAICVISTISLGLAACFTVIGIPLKPEIQSSKSNELFNILGSSGILGSATCDLMITISTIYHLRDQSTRTPLAGTVRVINKLIKYTLSTGLLTTVVAIITSAAILAHGGPPVYIPSYFVLTRSYMCSLVSILNSRSAVQEEYMKIANLNSKSASDGNTILTTVGLNFSQATCTVMGETADQFSICRQSNNESFHCLS